MLRVQNLSHRFENRVVLRNFYLELERGSCCAILGANGSGKSTFLRIVAGLLSPTRGSVSWQGKSLRGACALAAPDAPLARDLTVEENLRFFARTATLDELKLHLERWGLGSRADDLTGELSSGLRVRLQLAVAAWFKPAVLLLDEPSANLDEKGRELVARLLVEQKARGVTLLATNDSRDLKWCDVQAHL